MVCGGAKHGTIAPATLFAEPVGQESVSTVESLSPDLTAIVIEVKKLAISVLLKLLLTTFP